MLILDLDLRVNRLVGITTDLRGELRRLQMRLNYYRGDRNIYRHNDRRHRRQVERIQRYCLRNGIALPAWLFI